MFKNNLIKITVFIAVLFFINSISFGQNASLESDLERSFGSFELVQIDTEDSVLESETGKFLKIQTAEKELELVLQPHNLLSNRYRAEDTNSFGKRQLEQNQYSIFKGYIKREPDSEVRISLENQTIEGYFILDGERHFIESAIKYSPKAKRQDFIIYQAEEYLGESGFDCHSELVKRIEEAKDLVNSQKTQSFGRSDEKVLEIATEADFQFVNELGGAGPANAEILSTLNMIEGVYKRELNLTFQVVFQHTWSTNDPYSGSTSRAINNSFKDYWNVNFPMNEFPRDGAYLFSGKTQVISQGFAFIGTICSNPAFAYGTIGRVNFTAGQNLVTAHEIGHTIGGTHVGATQNCENTIMITSLAGNTPLTFCQFSRNEIGDYLNSNGSCLAPPNVSSHLLDFDGDRRTDVSIYRPILGEWWYLRSSDFGSFARQFGNSDDRPTPADYTGDGKTDIAFFRPSTSEWFVVRSEDSTFYSFPFGTDGDIPAPGDFDGDGTADIAVFRPSTTNWFIQRSSDRGTTIVGFGLSEDTPTIADFDGDGKDDIAIYRSSVSQWWQLRSRDGVIAYQFGSDGDMTVPGDYTGDGKADVAIFRPNTGEWFVLRSEDASFYSFPFGTATDIPTPGDYDGDGRFDAAVFRELTKTWFINGSTAGASQVEFGQFGDVPLASVYSAQ